MTAVVVTVDGLDVTRVGFPRYGVLVVDVSDTATGAAIAFAATAWGDGPDAGEICDWPDVQVPEGARVTLAAVEGPFDPPATRRPQRPPRLALRNTVRLLEEARAVARDPRRIAAIDALLALAARDG